MTRWLFVFVWGATVITRSLSAYAQPNVIAWGDASLTNIPPQLTNAVAVAAGLFHSVALKADGTVVAWGANTFQQTNVPAGLSSVIAIACGSYHSLALKENGTVVGWGLNSGGECNPPTGLTNVVMIAAGASGSFALLTDGSVTAWGSRPSMPSGSVGALSISCSSAASGAPTYSAVTVDGSVILCDGSSGGFGVVVELTNAVLATMGRPSVALTTEGRVLTRASSSGAFLDAGLSDVVSISVGFINFPSAPINYLALRRDGTVPGAPAGTSNVVAIACGYKHYLAVTGTGSPCFDRKGVSVATSRGRPARFLARATGEWPINYQWRFNGNPIPGATNAVLSLPNFQADQIGSYDVSASSGTGSATNPVASLSITPVQVPDFEWAPSFPDLAAIAMGPGFGLALDHNGSVAPWGWSYQGIPSDLSNVVSLSLCNRYYYWHSLALTRDGTVYSWGKNFFTNASPILTNIAMISAGPVGDFALGANGVVNQWTSSGLASPLAGVTNVVAIAATKYENAASAVLVKADGRIEGYRLPSSMTIPAGLSNVVSVAAGSEHGLALLGDGTVTAWGSNARGQTNVPVGLSNVASVVAESKYSVAIKTDGTIAAWGEVPAAITNLLPGIADAAAFDAGYTLIGNGPPFLTSIIVDRLGMPGGRAFFHATATGELPLSYQWKFKGQDLPGQTRGTLSLGNLSKLQTGDYSVVVANSLGSVTSAPAVLTVWDVGSALDTNNLTWVSFGNALWSIETNVTYDGVAAAQSGAMQGIGDSKNSVLETTVTGPGTLRFWWKTALTSGGEYISFFITSDGDFGHHASTASLTGQTDWQQQVFYLGPGKHFLDWVYRATTTFGGGTNAGWVDQVSFTPGVTAPSITYHPRDQAQAPTANATFYVGAIGTPPFAFQWQHEDKDISGATGADLTITDIKSSDSGGYRVLVSNEGGSVRSLLATLVVGKIATWGQSRLPANVTNAVSLAAGLNNGLALQNDGTVLTWGTAENIVTVPSIATNIAAIGAGLSFGLGIRASDGTVVGWGDNSSGQTDVPAGVSNVLAVAGGKSHSMVLKADGTLVVWGGNAYGQTNAPAGLTNVVAIAAGTDHCLALKSDGSVISWGKNDFGQTNVPASVSDIVSIRAGEYHSLALRSDGSVVAWGNPSTGGTVPGGLTNVIGISAGGEFNLVQKADGTLQTWGIDRKGDSAVAAQLRNVESFIAGYQCGFAIIGTNPPSAIVPVTHPSKLATSFQLAVPTEYGRVYRLEFKDSLDDQAWTCFPMVAGNGRDQILIDPQTPANQRFYRVRSW